MPESVLKSEFTSPYSPFNLPSTFDDNPVSGSESRTTSLDTSPYSPAPPVHLEHAWTEKIMKAEDKEFNMYQDLTIDPARRKLMEELADNMSSREEVNKWRSWKNYTVLATYLDEPPFKRRKTPISAESRDNSSTD
ncbi:hypothetical protein LTR64_004918 [Lithohypha guttulata]|uniref:uncharacterized protein n=1 Tax=Lithohypha guttulata TaxID=1690604 RepID=UPI00315D3BE5